MKIEDIKKELFFYRRFFTKYHREFPDKSYLVRFALLSKGSGEERIGSESIRDHWKFFLAHDKGKKNIKFYNHIPFCLQKCHYCCYFSYVSCDPQEKDRYISDISRYYRFFEPVFKNNEFSDLHIGGGTPNILEENQLKKLLTAIFSSFKFKNSGQKAIEFHPALSSYNKLKIVRNFGFNRISFGVQSFDKKIIKINNRGIQSNNKVRDSVNEAKKLGFNRINIDLLAGLYGDTSEKLAKSFKKAVSLNPDTIYIYPVQPTGHYLENICKVGERDFLNHKREMIDGAFDEITEIANKNGYSASVSLSAKTDSGKNGTISFYKDKNDIRDDFEDDEKSGSVFGIGLHSFSFIQNRIHYRMNEPLDCKPQKYLFSGNLCDNEKEMLYHIYTRINFKGQLSLSEFQTKFGKDFMKEFKIPILKLKAIKAIRVDDNILSFSTGKRDWLPFFLFFFGKNKIEHVMNKGFDRKRL